MSLAEVLEILQSGPMGVVLVASLWLLREIVGKARKKQDKLENAIVDNTHALIELKVKIEHLSAAVDVLPKLKKDIDEAHLKLRSLNHAQEN